MTFYHVNEPPLALILIVLIQHDIKARSAQGLTHDRAQDVSLATGYAHDLVLCFKLDAPPGLVRLSILDSCSTLLLSLS